MSPGPTFDRVYRALKDRLVEGALGPGEHLDPALLGEELFSSATPVRDVLHRLVGERLVEATRSDGFRVPLPSEAELRALYGWRKALLDLAMKGQAAMVAAGGEMQRLLPDGSTPLIADAEALFIALARCSVHREAEAAIASLNERLGLVREAERGLFPDLVKESERLWQSGADQDWLALRRGIAEFHRRRQRQVPQLIERAWRIAHNRQIGTV